MSISGANRAIPPMSVRRDADDRLVAEDRHEAASGAAAGAAGVDPEALLELMRAGDRAAAAEFLDRYRTRIRHRIRWKLAADMRRLFDSQEILSTVGRRLDLYVREGKVRATSPGQLHQFILAVTDSALIDKARRFRRLQRLEQPGVFADDVRDPLSDSRRAQRLHDAREEIETIVKSIDDPMDRSIFRLREREMNHNEIAREVGLSPESVRQRWSKLCRRL
ncbi:MAG: sigma-70 family RNA polymerase sigma factor, partial [Phycisphaerales bacterium]|nr:sigma-70 family RNA polymerase sigma factor [Phycisphaerales bacterium]